jgi:membrane protease YdiL (CAAX protease family)
MTALHAATSSAATNALLICVWLVVFAVVPVLALVHCRRAAAHARMALAVGLACAAMDAPAIVLALAFFDPSKAGPAFAGLPSIGLGLVVAGSVFAVAFEAGWNAVKYHAAASEWEIAYPEAMPVLRQRRGAPWRTITIAFLFGVEAGVLTLIAIALLDIKPNEELVRFMSLFPKLGTVSTLVRLPMMMMLVTAAAVKEELLFRGVLLGSLVRLSRGRPWAIAVSIVAVSLAFGMVHMNVASVPAFKVAQTFLLGVAFSLFALRGNLEVAIAAHVGLNLTAVAASLVLQ